MVAVSGRGAVLIHTAGVRKCSLCQSGPHEGFKCHASMRNGTLRAQSCAGPPKLCT